LLKTDQPKIKLEPLVGVDRQKNRLIPQAMLLGLLTGSVSVLFQLAMDSAEAIRNGLLAFAHLIERGPWLILGLTLVTMIFAVGLVRWLAPEASGSGIPHIKAILIGRRHFRWLRVLIAKFSSMIIGGVAGLVVGRAGPCVHMGSAIGQGLAHLWPNTKNADYAVLVAAGGGAGLAAAFNAPLAGLTFVLEELERRCSTLEFFTAAIACLTADMVCRAALGQQPAFHFNNFTTPPMGLLIAFVPLGILSALWGSLFTHALLTGQRLITLTIWPKWIWWITLALLLSVAAWKTPALLGGGQDFVNLILKGQTLPLETIGLFFISRFILTIGSSCLGAAGGIFMPILVLGTLLGWAMGVAIQGLFPELNVDPKLFAVVGMAAYFTAVVQAPLTAIVLIIEMTSNYVLILPLFIACFTALLIANWLGIPPVYEALLASDLRKDRRQERVC
jgi:CIC family chloride channel protein